MRKHVKKSAEIKQKVNFLHIHKVSPDDGFGDGMKSEESIASVQKLAMFFYFMA
ncbi:hypothetical protein Noda2021_09490 [Candidatus Dependentiae bacterium Noda2021]|nr:hypothetical protein Noda2021_09490 [Candidatus Dependentiae bacterium Noda2021]